MKLLVLELFSLEKKRLWGDLRAAFEYIKWMPGELEGGFFQGHVVTGQGRMALKWKAAIRKKFFTVKVVKHWNRFPREAVNTSSQAAFKARLNKALSNVIY